jgi:hypothetical protein
MACIIDRIAFLIINMTSFATGTAFVPSLIARMQTCAVGNRKSKKQPLI